MKSIDLNLNWQLQEGMPSIIPGMQAKTWEVNLPHDFVIGTDVSAASKNGSNTGYYNGGTTAKRWQ